MTLQSLLRRSSWARAALYVPRLFRRIHLRRQAQVRARVISTFAGLIAGDAFLRVPAFEGVFCINPNSDIFRRLCADGDYEPKLAVQFKALIEPDRDVLDVGANIGFYTVLAARTLRSGRVLAVEPTSAIYRRLTANAQANEVVGRVIAFQGLATERDGEAKLHVIEGREEYSSLGKLVHPATADAKVGVEAVRAATLDNLVSEYGLHPAVIKIDVEGAEALVLRGAGQILSRHRPVILAEYSPSLIESTSGSGKEIFEILHRHGYMIVDPSDLKPALVTAKFADILCIPKERWPEISRRLGA